MLGEYIFTDERMTDVNNDPAKLAGSYELLNLRAGLIFEQWDAEITLWGRNVLYENYTSTIGDGVAEDGRLIAYFNEPAIGASPCARISEPQGHGPWPAWGWLQSWNWNPWRISPRPVLWPG